MRPRSYRQIKFFGTEFESLILSCQEKPLKEIICYPYRKPTQVDEMSILRRVEEPWLRNSAK